MGLEIGKSSWLNAGHFEFMTDGGPFPVLLEVHWMPAVSQVHRDWWGVPVEARAIVIRLRGPDREGTERDTAKR